MKSLHKSSVSYNFKWHVQYKSAIVNMAIIETRRNCHNVFSAVNVAKLEMSGHLSINRKIKINLMD